MNASKENARKALDHLVLISDTIGPDVRNELSGHIVYLENFLEVAAKRLPKEETYRKDKERRRLVAEANKNLVKGD